MLSDDAGALQCAGIKISFGQLVLIFLIAFDQIRGILMQESHAEIDGEGIDHLTLFFSFLFDQETGADLVIEKVALLVLCIKLHVAERGKGNGEDTAALLCKKHADE